MKGIFRRFVAAILSVFLAVPAYVYDGVGNRTQRVSTLPGLPGGLTNYNANDQISTDTYDANGNTTASTGLGYAYDFENHLIQQGGITMVYDGDGNRVSKTVAGMTTSYLLDLQNPTGYLQVLEERFSGATGPNQDSIRSYVYGLARVSELRFLPTGGTQAVYYVYDGHGSVRAATSSFARLRARLYARRRNPLTGCECRMIHPTDPGAGQNKTSPSKVSSSLQVERELRSTES